MIGERTIPATAPRGQAGRARSGGTPSPVERAALAPGLRMRRAAAEFWLRALMRMARDAPRLAAAVRGPMVRATWWLSPGIRAGTLANAARILPASAGPDARAALGRRVVASFYDFVCDMGRNRHLSAQELADRVSTIEGDENFERAASQGRGMVIVTAHIGSFETAVAALRRRAERIHVVFKRDELPVFEAMRSAQRRKLGVMEAPVDEGWTMWLRLRNALLNNDVVLMQGDRLLPGQSGVRVPFLGGHMELPTGPAKLAIAAGSPLVPVFAVRTAGNAITVIVDEPIFIDPEAGGRQLYRVMLRLAETIGRQIARRPEQWLMLQPAWCEDRAPMDLLPDGQR